jgi:hypothetical protein
MRALLRRLNPTVPRGLLPALAGVAWGGVAIMLLVRAGGWLLASPPATSLAAAAAGISMAVFLIRRSFVSLVRRNLTRLSVRPERACLFSMFAWRSWAVALVMSVGGVLLRQSAAPRPLLAAMYVGMGLCLGVGAFHYFRFCAAGDSGAFDPES